jgi:hypothetical protein
MSLDQQIRHNHLNTQHQEAVHHLMVSHRSTRPIRLPEAVRLHRMVDHRLRRIHPPVPVRRQLLVDLQLRLIQLRGLVRRRLMANPLTQEAVHHPLMAVGDGPVQIADDPSEMTKTSVLAAEKG